MAIFKGSGGKVLLGGTDLDAMSWSMETTTNVFEKTELGDTWKTYVTGFNDWTATCVCVQKTETTPVSTLGTEAELKLYIDADNFFTGDAVVSNVAIVNTDDVCKITYTFEGSDEAATITASFT